jgi:hypothetical protein
MPLWRFVPVASRNDSHWQDRRIWHGLIVRAPSAAMARILAERAEERESRGAMGNETHSYRGGFADANLYWVQRLSDDEAEAYGGEAGEMGVVDPGTYEETTLSVEYGPTMERRGRKAENREAAK